MPGPGLNAYRRTVVTTSSGRELEAHVLTKAAHGLKECQAHWGEDGHRDRLDKALTVNQKIWSIFQSDLAGEENPLPQQIKNDLLSLSLFIDKRIIEIMADPSPEKLDAIININLNIAEGLRGSSAPAEAVETPEAVKSPDVSQTAMNTAPQSHRTVYSRAYAK